jgi:hypothetical protein
VGVGTGAQLARALATAAILCRLPVN